MALDSNGDELRDEPVHEQRGDSSGGGEAAYRKAGLADERAMDSMSLFLAEVRRHRLLTRAEEVALAQRIERGDLAAKEGLVNSNLRLVISNARSYDGLDLPLLDLIQEGMLGLIRAAEKFDWRNGYKFSTYATFWIRESIQRAVANRARPIRVPVHVGQRERRIARARQSLVARLSREPTDDEIAEAAELDLREVHATRNVARVVTSLDRPVGEEGETSLGALLASDATAPDEEVENATRDAPAVGLVLARKDGDARR
jgi:RNA polymerase primary sigma factor